MFNELTLNNIMMMVAGKRLAGDDVSDKQQGKEFIEIMNETVSSGGGANRRKFIPFLNWFCGGGGIEEKLKKLAKRADTFFQRLIDERRNKSALECKNTVIDHLLSQQESQPQYYTDEIIKGFIQVSTNFLLLVGLSLIRLCSWIIYGFF